MCTSRDFESAAEVLRKLVNANDGAVAVVRADLPEYLNHQLGRTLPSGVTGHPTIALRKAGLRCCGYVPGVPNAVVVLYTEKISGKKVTPEQARELVSHRLTEDVLEAIVRDAIPVALAS